MSLLEVLVALGILVAGLASVAALLPAASARLADATAIDRAGTLAANAHADLRNRGILTAATIFPTSPVITASSSQIRVLGPAFPDVPFATGTSFVSGTFIKSSPTNLTNNLLTLQDDLQLSGSVNLLSGTANPLITNPVSVTYAVTVVPTATGTISVGSPVRVGVVVFKRPNVDWIPVQLTKRGAGVFQVITSSTATAAQNELTRKRFFPSCSWSFATSGTAPAQSRWLRVGSSWTLSGTSFVSFSDADADIVASVPTNSSLTVQAFSNVLRVDERPAILR
jgi:hypothetical protein